VNDDDVGLFRDELGERLCAGVRAPVRVSHDIFVPQILGLLLHLAAPRLRNIDPHRHRNECDLSALEGVEVRLAAGVYQSVGMRAAGERSRKRDNPGNHGDDKSEFHTPFPP